MHAQDDSESHDAGWEFDSAMLAAVCFKMQGLSQYAALT